MIIYIMILILLMEEILPVLTRFYTFEVVHRISSISRIMDFFRWYDILMLVIFEAKLLEFAIPIHQIDQKTIADT